MSTLLVAIQSYSNHENFSKSQYSLLLYQQMVRQKKITAASLGYPTL